MEDILSFSGLKRHQRKEKTLSNPRNVSASLDFPTAVNEQCLGGTIGECWCFFLVFSIVLPTSAGRFGFLNMEISKDSMLLDERLAPLSKPPDSVSLITSFGFVPFRMAVLSMLNSFSVLYGDFFLWIKDSASTTFGLPITGKFLAFVHMWSNIVSPVNVFNFPSSRSEGCPATLGKK